MKRKFSEEQLFGLALSIGIVTTSIALALYAYLGIFSRYASDDYCLSAFFLQGDLVSRMIQRYFVTSDRYTNILFIGLVDKIFGWHNVAILPALMLILFGLGLYLLLKEIGEILVLGWSRWMVFLMAVSVAYFSIMQAPDLYQTLYWRAGMATHFAPLVFIPFFGTFLVRQIRNAKEHSPSFWVQAVCFIVPLLIGGFSEPPTALMITILILATFAGWLWGNPHSRRSILIVLLWSLMGALSALILMAVAPANSLRMQTPPPGLFELVSRIIRFPFYFIVDTLRTLPIPTLISVALPAVLFYVRYAHPSLGPSKEVPNRLGLLVIAVSIIGYLLIAASFAPSIYGQSYPVPRARFLGRVLMTSSLMIDGALLGMLVGNIKIRLFQSTNFRDLAIFVLMIMVLYPLRTAWRTSVDIPAYQQRAMAWDLRESEIRTLKVEGVRDLVVYSLPDEQVQDLGDHKNFRLNRCAAILYGVNSILALRTGGK
jgi:hypothetical protein